MRQANKQEIEALPHYDARLSFFYVQENDEFMHYAETARLHSTDKFFPTGAAIVKDDSVLELDSNQSGFKLSFFIRRHELGWCVRKWFDVPSGQKYWLCPGCAKPHDHAESRVARQAVEKHGDKVRGATLYLYGHWWCCKDCCEAMILAGISKVVLVEGAKAKFGR